MTFTYCWSEPISPTALSLDTRLLRLKVANMEEYRFADTPDKPLFRHPWREWRGVDIAYSVNGLPVSGSRGKTVWYVPAQTSELARAMGVPPGRALKIVKHPVHGIFNDEYTRLQQECAIQNTLAAHGYATRADGLVLIVNEEDNVVRWFDHIVYHPRGSLYLATVVEDVPAAPLPMEVELSKDFLLTGKPIDELRAACRSASIAPYDVCLGNILGSPTGIKVVDVHKWIFTRGELHSQRLLETSRRTKEQ